MSAQCPRNLFTARSGEDVLTHATSEASTDSPSGSLGDQAAPNTQVRERSAAPATHQEYEDRVEGPAHPSDRLVAQLNSTWRVVDDPLQWILQRKKGNPRDKNSGWRAAPSAGRETSCCAASANTAARLPLRPSAEFRHSLSGIPTGIAKRPRRTWTFAEQTKLNPRGHQRRAFPRDRRIAGLAINRLTTPYALLLSWCCLSGWGTGHAEQRSISGIVARA